LVGKKDLAGKQERPGWQEGAVVATKLFIRPLDIPDVLLIIPPRIRDDRGYFMET